MRWVIIIFFYFLFETQPPTNKFTPKLCAKIKAAVGIKLKLETKIKLSGSRLSL